MIKNIVFDIGNVLIDFNPRAFIKEFKFGQDIEERLMKTVFGSVYWQELDRGTLEEQEALKLFCANEAELHKEIQTIMDRWTDMLLPKKDTISILEELSRSGYNLYYLSNYHKHAFKLTQERNSFFKLFCGGIVSFEINSIKPEEEIYKLLLEKYRLKPRETVFIDDSIDNITAALKLSINGIHFKDADSLRKSLANLEIKL